MNNSPSQTSWKDLPFDILVKIFMALDILDVVAGVSRVCTSWRAASRDPKIWNSIDLSKVKFNSGRIPETSDDLYIDGPSNKIMLVLKNSLKLNRGNVSCLIFQFYAFLTNEHLLYIAERTPNLKRLVLPAWNKLDVDGFDEAIKHWSNLESLTVPCVYSPCNMMKSIGAYCNNFSEIKIMCPVDSDFALSIASHTPNLKVLSLRCTVVFKQALLILLKKLNKLEVLNLAHSLMVCDTREPGFLLVFEEIDDEIIKNTKHVKTLITCQKNACPMCRVAVDQEDFLKWYNYEEENWKLDEIPSLTV
ncbi:F-box/LRR-repeat protein At3g48880-like [Humulus lupulus]|uniref:F-box/LRR-repeat protein At3g48880-like n=1 Tax=Humulus lupulus TaxID=3486 RepID=UPI002B4167EF|nr:F-box/LRR-repeat protein At3g48880-like [Humulus lupulus]